MYIFNKFKSGVRSILTWSIIYKFIFFWIALYNYLKDYNRLGEFFYSDTFKKLLKEYVNIDIEKDWLGRLYGVINPNLDIEGNLNVNNMIIELDGTNSNDNEYVKTWIYKQLNLIGQLFKIHNLYNYISMDMERVGPINGDNFLVVFDIISRQEMARYFKSFIKQLLFYVVIALIIIFVIL